MSTDPQAASAAAQQQRVAEFLRLLPLTLEIAGLPRAEHGKSYNEGLMELRANAIRTAYKICRQLVVEVAGR